MTASPIAFEHGDNVKICEDAEEVRRRFDDIGWSREELTDEMLDLLGSIGTVVCEPGGREYGAALVADRNGEDWYFPESCLTKVVGENPK